MGGANKQMGVVLIACTILFLGTSTVEGIACCSGSRYSCCYEVSKLPRLRGPVPATIPWLPTTPIPAPGPGTIPWLPVLPPVPSTIPWLIPPTPAPSTIPWLPLIPPAPAPSTIPWLPFPAPTTPTPAPATSVGQKKVLGRKAYTMTD